MSAARILSCSTVTRPDNADPLYAEVLEAIRLVTASKGRERVNYSYVGRAVLNVVRDSVRRVVGFARCGNCRRYLASSRSCEVAGAPYRPGSLGPQERPSRLEPPCQHFETRRIPVDLMGLAETATADNAASGTVEWGMDVLRIEHPEDQALLWEVYFERVSRREIARRLGVTRRQIAILLDAASRRLRRILEDHP
jgi:hypothetical protein